MSTEHKQEQQHSGDAAGEPSKLYEPQDCNPPIAREGEFAQRTAGAGSEYYRDRMKQDQSAGPHRGTASKCDQGSDEPIKEEVNGSSKNQDHLDD